MNRTVKEYESVWFDVDGTLLDFNTDSYAALTEVFAGLSISNTPATRAVFDRCSRGLWRQYESGTIGMDDIFKNRFRLFGRELCMEINGERGEEMFQAEMCKRSSVINGAVEMLNALRGKYRLLAVTNGNVRTQVTRMNEAGFSGFFDDILTSQSLGAQKPDGAFFEKCFALHPECVKESTLMVGDSYSADICGGKRAGLDTCWFNPGGLEDTAGLCDWQIQSLSDLLTILER